MSGEEKVLQGLKLLKEGCKEIQKCTDCPFDRFGCIEFTIAKSPLPYEWEIDENE